MAPAASLPIDVVGLIFNHIYSTSVESLEQWEECLPLLSLNSYWREIYKPKLYSCAIVECGVSMNRIMAKSNLPLIFKNDFQDDVKSVIFYALEIIETNCNSQMLYSSIACFLETWLDMAVFAPLFPSVSTVISSQITRIIEPLLLKLPNLVQVIMHKGNIHDTMSSDSILLSYSTIDTMEITDALVDETMRYIIQVKFQRMNLFSEFTNNFSSYGHQFATHMQLFRFSAELLDDMSKWSINNTFLAREILREYFAGDYTGLSWSGYERTSFYRHFVCHPGIKCTDSDGAESVYDIFRLVCAEHSEIMNTQSLWS